MKQAKSAYRLDLNDQYLQSTLMIGSTNFESPFHWFFIFNTTIKRTVLELMMANIKQQFYLFFFPFPLFYNSMFKNVAAKNGLTELTFKLQ